MNALPKSEIEVGSQSRSISLQTGLARIAKLIFGLPIWIVLLSLTALASIVAGLVSLLLQPVWLAADFVLKALGRRGFITKTSRGTSVKVSREGFRKA